MKNFNITVSLSVLLSLYTTQVSAWGSMTDDIYNAARRGNIKQLETYANRGNLDATNSNGTTALCKAYAEGNTRAYNLLLQYGANPSAQCMFRVESLRSSGINRISPTAYVVGGVVLAGAGIAAAAGGGGGGGGSGGSGGASSSNSSDSNHSNNSSNNSDSSENNSGNNSSGSNIDGGSVEVGDEAIIGGTPGGGYNYGVIIGDEEIISGGDNTGGSGITIGDEVVIGGGDSGNTGGGDSGNTGSGDSGNTGGGDSGNTGGGDSGNTGGGDSGNTGGSGISIGDEVVVGGDDDPTPILNGNVATFYPESYYLNKSEYTGQSFGSGNKQSVNYLGAINAAKAYSYFIGEGADGKLATNLQDVKVGVVDTGVWLTHSEFKLDDGSSKVSGYNYDFGPCRNGDTTHCWGIKLEGLSKKLVFYIDSNKYTSYDWYLTSAEVAEFEKWSSFYPDNYDWDKLKTNIEPNLYISSTGAYEPNNMHGTHVSGLIAANMDDKGMMGVAFANAKIIATRWDFQSTLLNPVNYLLKNGARIINLSMGMSSTSESENASHLSSDNDLSSGFRNSMQAVLAKNSNKNGKVDGVIVVKAAGNEGVSNPDLQSGIKNLNAYKDLQMLVVVAADVTINQSTGKLQRYSLASYSNQCGVTKGYCLAAPGGSNSGGSKGIYSSGQIGGSQNYYATIGTSQAAPIVSGALAFLEGAFPYMSSQEIIELVLATANRNKNIAPDYSEEKYGAGMLDLGAAVTTYIPYSQDMQTATFSGNSVQSMPVNLDGASLVVPTALQEAVQRALPASITTFDRYNRPFDKSTANFVHTTHGGYKTLKNDVQNIAMPQEMPVYKEGNLSFQYAESMRKNGQGEKGYFNISYKSEKHSSSFYFSENTAYKSAENAAREMKNPFMAMNNAYGVRHDYDFSKKMRFKFEAMSGENGLYDGDKDFNDDTFKRRAYAVNMGVQLHQDKKYSLALSSGILYEEDALLGANGKGAFSLNGGNTYTVGVHATWKPVDKFTLSGSYYLGYTAAQSFETDLLRTSKIESSSFALEGDYEADKTMHYGLRFSSPLRVEKGRLFVDFPSGRDNFSDTVYRNTYAAGLKPSKREYKLAAYWQKKISDKISLRTESGVRFNPEHQNAANDYRALLGLSWTFN
jgi:hypothetical protein